MSRRDVQESLAEYFDDLLKRKKNHQSQNLPVKMSKKALRWLILKKMLIRSPLLRRESTVLPALWILGYAGMTQDLLKLKLVLLKKELLKKVLLKKSFLKKLLLHKPRVNQPDETKPITTTVETPLPELKEAEQSDVAPKTLTKEKSNTRKASAIGK